MTSRQSWQSGIKWLFFDLGETLIDESEAMHDIIGQFVQSAREIGLRPTPAQISQAIRDEYRRFEPFPMRSVMERWVPEEERRAGIRKNMKYRKELERPYPGAVPLLEKLASRYRIGIIANQGPGTRERIESYGFAPFVDVCCASAEAGLAKPDPRFFLLALEQARCRPEQAVMIGDRVDNDILPAKRLGMKAILVRQGDARDQPIPDSPDQPDAVVERIDELLPLLISDSAPS